MKEMERIKNQRLRESEIEEASNHIKEEKNIKIKEL